MRLGWEDTIANVVSNGNSISINPGLLDQWSALSTVFASWRQVAWKCTFSPESAPAASGTYAVVPFDYSNATLPPAPTSLAVVISIPGCKVRALNSVNAASVISFDWRTRDEDALIFQTTATTSETLNNTGVSYFFNQPSAWSVQLYGWIDVEFKGLIGI